MQSVYADIALTLGNYIKQATGIGGPETIVEVGDMHIQSALVANDADKQQLLRSTAKFDAKKKAASLTFSSIDVCPLERIAISELTVVTEQRQDPGAACQLSNSLRRPRSLEA